MNSVYLFLSHPGTGIIAKSFVNVCPAIGHHNLNGIPYPPGIQNFSTRKAQPCSFIGWTINIYSTVCIFHSTKINGFTIKFCHRSSFYVSISNFLLLYSEMDEMKNFLTTFFNKMHFFQHFSQSLLRRQAGSLLTLTLWCATHAQLIPCLGQPFVQEQSMWLCVQGIYSKLRFLRRQVYQFYKIHQLESPKLPIFVNLRSPHLALFGYFYC